MRAKKKKKKGLSVVVLCRLSIAHGLPIELQRGELLMHSMHAVRGGCTKVQGWVFVFFLTADLFLVDGGLLSKVTGDH